MRNRERTGRRKVVYSDFLGEKDLEFYVERCREELEGSETFEDFRRRTDPIVPLPVADLFARNHFKLNGIEIGEEYDGFLGQLYSEARIPDEREIKKDPIREGIRKRRDDVVEAAARQRDYALRDELVCSYEGIILALYLAGSKNGTPFLEREKLIGKIDKARPFLRYETEVRSAIEKSNKIEDMIMWTDDVLSFQNAQLFARRYMEICSRTLPVGGKRFDVGKLYEVTDDDVEGLVDSLIGLKVDRQSFIEELKKARYDSESNIAELEEKRKREGLNDFEEILLKGYRKHKLEVINIHKIFSFSAERGIMYIDKVKLVDLLDDVERGEVELKPKSAFLSSIYFTEFENTEDGFVPYEVAKLVYEKATGSDFDKRLKIEIENGRVIEIEKDGVRYLQISDHVKNPESSLDTLIFDVDKVMAYAAKNQAELMRMIDRLTKPKQESKAAAEGTTTAKEGEPEEISQLVERIEEESRDSRIAPETPTLVQPEEPHSAATKPREDYKRLTNKEIAYKILGHYGDRGVNQREVKQFLEERDNTIDVHAVVSILRYEADRSEIVYHKKEGEKRGKYYLKNMRPIGVRLPDPKGYKGKSSAKPDKKKTKREDLDAIVRDVTDLRKSHIVRAKEKIINVRRGYDLYYAIQALEDSRLEATDETIARVVKIFFPAASYEKINGQLAEGKSMEEILQDEKGSYKLAKAVKIISKEDLKELETSGIKEPAILDRYDRYTNDKKVVRVVTALTERGYEPTRQNINIAMKYLFDTGANTTGTILFNLIKSRILERNEREGYVVAGIKTVKASENRVDPADTIFRIIATNPGIGDSRITEVLTSEGIDGIDMHRIHRMVKDMIGWREIIGTGVPMQYHLTEQGEERAIGRGLLKAKPTEEVRTEQIVSQQPTGLKKPEQPATYTRLPTTIESVVEPQTTAQARVIGDIKIDHTFAGKADNTTKALLAIAALQRAAFPITRSNIHLLLDCNGIEMTIQGLSVGLSRGIRKLRAIELDEGTQRYSLTKIGQLEIKNLLGTAEVEYTPRTEPAYTPKPEQPAYNPRQDTQRQEQDRGIMPKKPSGKVRRIRRECGSGTNFDKIKGAIRALEEAGQQATGIRINEVLQDNFPAINLKTIGVELARRKGKGELEHEGKGCPYKIVE